MTRKSDREEREARSVDDLMVGALEHWGIIMYDEDGVPADTRAPGLRFAEQIGDDEAVEYEEVHSLIRDLMLQAYNMGREVTDVPLLAEYRPLRAEIDDLPFDRNIPVTEDAWKREHAAYEGGWDYSELSQGRKPRLVAVEWTDATETPSETMRRFDVERGEAWEEVLRLRQIIARAYGKEGWDIGSVKNLLIAGLEGYEKSGWAKLHEPVGIPTGTLSFHANNWMLGFGEGSSEHSWWIELELYHVDDDKTDDAIVKAVLVLDDKEALTLSERLEERVREGRKDWS